MHHSSSREEFVFEVWSDWVSTSRVVVPTALEAALMDSNLLKALKIALLIEFSVRRELEGA